MRSIKFRAWYIDKYYRVKKLDFDKNCVEIDTEETKTRCPKCHKVIYPGIMPDIPFDICVPEQFTGLLDKNGKEIYEGDIVSDFGGINGIVVFENGMFCIKWDMQNFYPLITETTDVIGNIHENPELMK